MSDAAFYENSWAELLKASRGWQIQYDVRQLLTDVCHTAHDLLGFEQATAFLLENNGVIERAQWPEAAPAAQNLITVAPVALPDDARAEVARSVIQSGRSVFMQKTVNGKPATMLCAPLTSSREILGALHLLTTQQSRLIGDKDQQFFELLASQAAASLEHTLLYQSAITDPLTGLFCHRHFRQEVDQAVRRAIRNEEPVTLLLMDLDHFKALNDSCGHEAGNKCLLQVASILRAMFRSTDILARFGGDEFEVLLLDTGAEDALKVAEKVREKIAEIPLPQKKQVTATIGVASFPLNSFSAQPLFLCADAALYSAKESGRNRVVQSTTRPGDKTAADSNSVERAVRLLGSAKPEDETPARPSALRPGAVEMVDGHIVKRRLGVGSTGEVLLVTQPGLDRDVALKRPLTPHATFEQSQAFEREAKVTAGLNHPGIVPVFNIGRDQDNRRYYTMKPLDGKTLLQILEARRKGDMEMLHAFTPGRLLDILHRVSETVAYAHARNVLHLDLTPGNILVGQFGEVTVIDWSTGSHESYSHGNGQDGKNQGVKLVGSASFIAPELLRGPKQGCPASDVFALGTLLYHVLTDELPFHRPTTSESLEALVNGQLTPPDVLKPESGIDPVLSALCVDALQTEPARRPTTQAFAERMGLFLRGESDWTTIRFGSGPGAHGMREIEWHADEGQWLLEGDTWITQTRGQGLLTWKVAVPGSFRFSCEAWADNPDTELSIVGHRPPPGSKGFERYSGYFFQVGAEYNTVYKFARHDNDVLVRHGLPVEPGRRYRIEMEYQDAEGLIHCAVNGKRIFTYRELFPFAGSQIGFYSFLPGTHYRPLELQRQNWNVQLPALRAADRHFQYGHYDSALECYREIATNLPDRVQGAEAQFKAGICEAEMGKFKEAFATLEHSKGTLFEPFALAERAMYEIHHNPQFDAPLKYFEELFKRFPESQARVRIFDASRWMRWAVQHPVPRAQTIHVLAELNRLATEHFDPPAQSQIGTNSRLISYLAVLGLWDEALDSMNKFLRRLSEKQLVIHEANAPMVALALARDRMDLFPKHILENGIKGVFDYPTGLVIHHAIHLNAFPEWKKRMVGLEKERSFGCLVIAMAERDMAASKKVIDAHHLHFNRVDHQEDCWRHGFLLAESMEEELFQKFIDIYGNSKTNGVFVDDYKALWAVQRCEFDQAAGLLGGIRRSSHFQYNSPRILLQAMLSSLGLLKSPTADELRALLPYELCGTALDLAQMFLGDREPVPGKVWPGPRWHPELRVMLGLWLEAKGKVAEARALIEPCRDPRYGWLHSQPAIEAFLKRTAAKSK